MFKVIIIDDEPIVRKGMLNVINWESLNCKVVAEASNGLEGIEMIRFHKPEVIITDINMPEVDGLTMIKSVKSIVPDSKIVILTGYRDFEYMQEAIRLGASDYLLKPSKIEELIQTIKKVTMSLQYDMTKDESFKELKKYFDKTIPVLRENILSSIINQAMVNEDEVEEALALYELKIGQYTAVMIDIDGESIKDLDNYHRHLYKFGIRNTFEEMYKDEYVCHYVDLPANRMVLIVEPKLNSLDFREDVLKKVEAMQSLIESCFSLNTSFSISTVGRGWKSLPAKVEECYDGMDYKVYMGDKAIVLFEDLPQKKPQNTLLILDKLRYDLLKMLKIGDKSNADSILRRIQTEVEGRWGENESDIKIYLINLFIALNAVEKNSNFDANKMIKWLENQTDIQTIFESLNELINHSVLKFNQEEKENIGLIIKRAIEFIEEHFRESLTLNDVADQAYVSTYYLSRMFTKETGKTFVEYLNDVRINEAKKMLKNPMYKTYEVAEMVGISDPHYFSKLFKKVTKMTPTEFRNKN